MTVHVPPPGLPSQDPMDVGTEWPSIHPDSLAIDPAAGVWAGDPEAIGRFWCATPQPPIVGVDVGQLPPGYSYGAHLAGFATPGVPPYAEAAGAYFQENYPEEGVPLVAEPPTPVRPKKKGPPPPQPRIFLFPSLPHVRSLPLPSSYSTHLLTPPPQALFLPIPAHGGL